MQVGVYLSSTTCILLTIFPDDVGYHPQDTPRNRNDLWGEMLSPGHWLVWMETCERCKKGQPNWRDVSNQRPVCDLFSIPQLGSLFVGQAKKKCDSPYINLLLGTQGACQTRPNE